MTSIYQDTGLGGLIFQPSKKRDDPVANLVKRFHDPVI